MNVSVPTTGGLPPPPLVMHLQGPSRAAQIIVGCLVPEVFATLFFTARVYARGWLLHSWGWDDTVLSISWVGSVVLIICSGLATKYGSGHHIWDIPMDPYEFAIPSLKVTYVGTIVYQSTVAITKISVCLFYLRLFPDRQTRYLVFATIGFICLYTIPVVAFDIFACHPISGYWDVTMTSKTCHNPIPAFWINSLGNIMTDCWLVVMMIPRIRSLKMVRRQKIALFAIMTLSWLAAVAAIVRVVRLCALQRGTVVDLPWGFYDVSIWSGLEVCVGIICVSAASLKPIVRIFAPNLFETISSIFDTSISRSKPSASHNYGRNRWTSRSHGAIELSGQDQTTESASSVTRVPSSQSGIETAVQAKNIEFDHDVEGDEFPIMRQNMGGGYILKSTTVKIRVSDREKQ